MAHRGGRNRSKPNNCFCKHHGFNKNYWQSDEYNARMYNFYFNLIEQMAMSRFKWIGLPNTCDAWFLERTLFYEGFATIATPKNHALTGSFFSTRAVTKTPPNVYDRPTQWYSMGNRGWSFEVDPTNGVLVFDNTTRMPLSEGVSLYASELTHIQLTKRMNRFHQQIPWILVGPQEKKYDMQNLVKQVAGGELAILATNGMDSFEPKTLATNVPYIVDKMNEDERQVWDNIYIMLGYDNNPFKAERQTSDEIKAQQSPASGVRMAYLQCRRDACDDLNNYFGKYFPEEVRCVWNDDYESDNWALMNNAKMLLEAGA
jgi:hypothetical protein